MSLINDMLKDLDERQSSQPVINPGNGADRTLKPVPARGKTRYVSIVIGVCVLFVGVVAYAYKTQWWSIPNASDTIGGPAKSDGELQVPAVSTASESLAAVQASESVVRIEHTATQSGETFELILSNAVKHQLIEASNQNLQLRLFNTRLASRPPEPPLGTVIEAVDMRQDHGDSIVSFAFREPSRAKTYLLTETTGSRLVVELAASGLPATQPTAQPAPVNEYNVAEVQKHSVNEVPVAPKKPSEPATTDVSITDASFAKSKPQLTPQQLDENASEQGMILAARGNLRQAISYLRGFVASSERNLLSRTTLAKLLLRSGDDPAALALVVDARIEHAEDLELQKLHSRILLAQGLLEQALGVMNAISAERLDLEYMALRASLQQRTNAHAEAIASYDLLLAQQGAHPPWLIGQAISLEAEGNTAIAKNNYQRALRVSGIDARLKEYAIERLKQLN